MTASRLEKALAYTFSDSSLLQTALTHRSHSSPHNERLEFIGDSILNCVIALELFRRFPSLAEGEMSRLRANLVRQETLHQIAETLAIGTELRLGEGEMKSGGNQRPSILADAVEALIGAVHQDSSFDHASRLVVGLYKERLDAVVPGQQIKDPKTRLQEYLQGRRMPLPKYSLMQTSGEAHAQNFCVACEIPSLRINTQGIGQSRRAAEQMAAEKALETLK
ncbi:MAG: ribonuclease III [Zoogloeaceae bacterium]|nr:ribonuclease III [Zoogloeaceae bacterium]